MAAPAARPSASSSSATGPISSSKGRRHGVPLQLVGVEVEVGPGAAPRHAACRHRRRRGPDGSLLPRFPRRRSRCSRCFGAHGVRAAACSGVDRGKGGRRRRRRWGASAGHFERERERKRKIASGGRERKGKGKKKKGGDEAFPSMPLFAFFFLSFGFASA